MLLAAFGRLPGESSRRIQRAAQAVLAGFAAAVLILLVVGALAEAGFALVYGIGFGTLAWFLRDPLRRAAPLGRGSRLAVFLVISIGGTVGEELLVVAIGGRVAQPVLWVDLLWVSLLWAVWQLAWYRPSPAGAVRRFALSPVGAIVCAGATGILFEVVLSRLVFIAPLEGLVLAPVAWVIYSAAFTLPSALLEDPPAGSVARSTVLIAVVGPFLLAVAVALPLLFLLPLFGIPLR